MLALGRNIWVWSMGGFLGWIGIPLMNANLDVVLRLNTPVSMQGRVYSVRNSLQFFTIPLGYLLGGVLVDYVFEPAMAAWNSPLLTAVFGSGKGSGAALFSSSWPFWESASACFPADPGLRELENRECDAARRRTVLVGKLERAAASSMVS